MKIHARLISAGALLCASASTFAVSTPSTLLARDLDGDASTVEAYYDTELRITWLADVLAISGSAFDFSPTLAYTAPGEDRAAWDAAVASETHDGITTAADASAWAASLRAGNTAGWRLPAVFTPPLTPDSDEGCPCGIAASASSSELGHLYFATLEGAFGPSSTGPFHGLDWRYNLWTDDGRYSFAHRYELSYAGVERAERYMGYAWAVHDGDIGAAPLTDVPEPSRWLLMLAAIGLYSAMVYRSRISG